MVTISEVAREAGVSISTVSYTLSRKRPISAETRERVEAAIKRLNFVPKASARALAARRSGIIAVTAPFHADTDPSDHMLFAMQVTVAARAHGYDTLLLVDDDALEGMQRSSSTALADGIIVLDVAAHDQRAELARAIDSPAVFIGVPDDASDLTCVDVDFENAVREALEQLVAAGHRSVGLLSHPIELFERDSGYATRIVRAFTSETERLGLEGAVVHPTTERAHEAVTELLAKLPGVTALIASTSMTVARSLTAAFTERGVHVPDDMSIVTVGMIPVPGRKPLPFNSLPLDPKLTCPVAVDLLVAEIEGAESSGVRLLSPTYQDLGTVAQARVLEALG